MALELCLLLSADFDRLLLLDLDLDLERERLDLSLLCDPGLLDPIFSPTMEMSGDTDLFLISSAFSEGFGGFVMEPRRLLERL